MAKFPLAVVTMLFDEPDLLPVWAAHYWRQVGYAHRYVIDHGSGQAREMLAGLPHVVTLPRSCFDQLWRCRLVSEFCNRLLETYDCVAYTDVDELLVADPRRHASLVALCRAGIPEVLTAFGADLLQMEEEAPIDFGRRIPAQRRYARPFSSLCKPSLIRRPVSWRPGFHYVDAPSRFGDLYLFHLAYADFAIIERRQRKRVSVERPPGASHHRIPPEEMLAHIRHDYVEQPRRDTETFGGRFETAFRQELLAAGRPEHGGRTIGADIIAPELWRLPHWFAGRF